MLIGAMFPIAFLILEQVPSTKDFAAWVGPNWSGIMSFAAAGAAMVIGSLIKPGHINTPIAGGVNA
jgi:SSS family solute:Na+ symporter